MTLMRCDPSIHVYKRGASRYAYNLDLAPYRNKASKRVMLLPFNTDCPQRRVRRNDDGRQRERKSQIFHQPNPQRLLIT